MLKHITHNCINTFVTVSTKTEHSVIKVDLMAEQLYLIALDCTGVPNKIDIEYIPAASQTRASKLQMYLTDWQGSIFTFHPMILTN